MLFILYSAQAFVLVVLVQKLSMPFTILIVKNGWKLGIYSTDYELLSVSKVIWRINRIS
jgi:hypothetical protein